MAGFKLDAFRGIRPRYSATKLRLGDAITAENLRLGSGDLEPIPEKTTVQAVSSGRKSRTIYRFNNAGSPLWFEWDDYVDVVRGPVKDDSIERTYYTGDTTGNGAPKMTTTELADLGNGGPYPEDWLYIGVPAPTAAPTVTAADLPEDLSANRRIASNFKTDEFEISEVKWTIYPGVGTRNQTWRPDATAGGTIKFDIQPGASFRVTGIINSNRVTIESATEPGLTMRTVNLDKSTTDDWKRMDEQGSTQEADFIGWRVPVDMVIGIPGHNLLVGDVISVSAVSIDPEIYFASTTDFYEQNWETPVEIESITGDFFYVADAAVSASAVSGTSQWAIQGSFYYDVDRLGSLSNELEDRQYVYTYVNSFGEEGPPSSPSEITQVLDGQSVLLSDMSIPPTIGYDITKMRLYRTNSTEAGTEYQFVKEFDVSRTTRDAVKSQDLSEVIASTTFDPPPAGMLGIVSMPNGMLVGFKGKQLYFCEPYSPHAWPAEYDQAIDYDIVGLASFGTSVAVLTKGWPYVITGSHPRNANARPIKINQACVSKESIATDGDKVYYASPDGIIELGVNGMRNVTEDVLDKDDWATYSPSNIVAEFYEGRYYAFYDFDTSVVDDVRTAEVSGTITDADEADIVAGGRVITITLTGDTWVTAGATFDAQRQNIIDGISDTGTPQTLGWDNIVRDTNLAVTDVVRTSDSVVTITLPANPTYSIVTAETIQVTIPNEALTISTSDLKTGSTFKIEPQLWQAAVVFDGSLNGATEAQIVSGGRSIWLTLTKDKWISLADGFNDYRQELIDGLIATTDEVNGWNDTMPQLISVDDVDRNTDSIVIIPLPANADYSITANEKINATVPHEMLQTQEDVDVTTLGQAAIIATGETAALFGGTLVTGGVLEADIVAGGETLTITLTNDTWAAAGTGVIGSVANTQALVDAITAASSPATGWNNVVLPGIEVGTAGAPADVIRTSATVVTITLDPESTYSIAADEVITCTIPAAALASGVALDVSNSFPITHQSQTTAQLGGTMQSALTYEADIVAGGKTLTLELFDDEFLAEGVAAVGSVANTNAIIDGLNAATSPAGGWNDQIANTSGGGSLTESAVTRVSDSKISITLPADAGYDITGSEVITATIPAAVLVTGTSDVVASPTATVYEDVTATAAITGTITSSANESDIVTGGETLIITLTGDTFVAAGATFNAIRQDIIDGLDSAQSEAGGWNNQVRDAIAETTVVRTSSTVVTITLPAIAGYSITENETITVTVPASAMVLTASPISTSPTTFGILAQAAPTTAVLSGTVTASIDEDDIVAGGNTIILTLSDDTWLATGTGPIGSTANTQAIIDGIVAASSPGNSWNDVVGPGIETTDVVRTSDTVCTITLDPEATYDLSYPSTETITATIPAAALNISAIDVVATPTFTVVAVAPPDPTIALTGTVTASIDEADIVAGGNTIILTVTNDTWAATGTGPIGSTADTEALIAGISAAASPVNGFNLELRDGSMSTSDVVRTSDTVCTITLPADAQYDISADETITVTVPAACLTTFGSPVVASPTFNIADVPYVLLTGEIRSEYVPGGACYSGYRFNSDGSMTYIGPGATDYTSIDAGEWYSNHPDASIGASYEVRFLSAGKTGSWDTTPAADDVWVDLSTSPVWRLGVLAMTSPDTQQCTGTFEIRLAGSGSALTSATYQALAEN